MFSTNTCNFMFFQIHIFASFLYTIPSAADGIVYRKLLDAHLRFEIMVVPLVLLQRKNQGFCPSVARQKLTIAPIGLNSFLKGPQWTFVKSH